MELSSRLMMTAPRGDAEDLGSVAKTALRVSDSALAVIAVPDGEGVLRCGSSFGVQGLQAGQEITGSDLVIKVIETGESVVARDPRHVFDDEVAEKLGSVLVCALGPATAKTACCCWPVHRVQPSTTRLKLSPVHFLEAGSGWRST